MNERIAIFNTFDEFFKNYLDGENFRQGSNDMLFAATPIYICDRTVFEVYDNNMWSETIIIHENCVDRVTSIQ